MRHPIDPLPGVKETLPLLAARARLVLVTKGDLFHQESKLAASGLGDHFAGVEIVSEKTAETYERVFARYGAEPGNAVMVGNSLRSDIWPALRAGAWAVHIPHEFEWARERAETPENEPRFAQACDLRGACRSGWRRASREDAARGYLLSRSRISLPVLKNGTNFLVDRHLVAGPRIAAGARLPLFRGKGAESAQLHAIAARRARRRSRPGSRRQCSRCRADRSADFAPPNAEPVPT